LEAEQGSCQGSSEILKGSPLAASFHPNGLLGTPARTAGDMQFSNHTAIDTGLCSLSTVLPAPLVGSFELHGKAAFTWTVLNVREDT